MVRMVGERKHLHPVKTYARVGGNVKVENKAKAKKDIKEGKQTTFIY